mmetsp:Transcript_10450/g.23675  ORF Transcript_10450/g.23675 Transcript_10450/m.23675 type:complete len:229 (+) Transcript_10450:602-1288(+)
MLSHSRSFNIRIGDLQLGLNILKLVRSSLQLNCDVLPFLLHLAELSLHECLPLLQLTCLRLVQLALFQHFLVSLTKLVLQALMVVSKIIQLCLQHRRSGPLGFFVLQGLIDLFLELHFGLTQFNNSCIQLILQCLLLDSCLLQRCLQAYFGILQISVLCLQLQACRLFCVVCFFQLLAELCLQLGLDIFCFFLPGLELGFACLQLSTNGLLCTLRLLQLRLQVGLLLF